MATLKEKIHHLDDMLKSQQRKVRHMIEQVFMSTGRLPSFARCTHTQCKCFLLCPQIHRKPLIRKLDFEEAETQSVIDVREWSQEELCGETKLTCHE